MRATQYTVRVWAVDLQGRVADEDLRLAVMAQHREGIFYILLAWERMNIESPKHGPC